MIESNESRTGEQMQPEGGEPKGKRSKRGAGFTRRSFALGAIGACALAVLGAGVKVTSAHALLRPPGGQQENALIGACLHCEKCREVCPHTAIGATHVEEGLLNARTPSMDFKSGWCDFCASELGGPKCLAVCPTGALALPGGAVVGDVVTGDPGNVVLGKAEVNRDWCLAQRGMGCHECVDACPFGALSLGYDNSPVVDDERCNGCGACENACISLAAGAIAPGATDRAIVVKPVM